MQRQTFFFSIAALLGGMVLGWQWPPARIPHQAGPEPRPIANLSVAGTATKKLGILDTEQLSSSKLLEYLSALEKATAHEVYREMRFQANTDDLRNELAKARFLRFPAAQKLAALSDPDVEGMTILAGFSDSVASQSIGELLLHDPKLILNDPTGAAKLLGLFRNEDLDVVTKLIEPLFSRDGWDGSQNFLELLPPKTQEKVKAVLLAMLAKTDLPRAQAECLKAPEGKGRNALLGGVAIQMAETDARAAFAWLHKYIHQATGFDSRSGNPAAQLLGQIMEKDSLLAATLLMENQAIFSQSYGSEALSGIWQAWATKNFQEASTWLAANPLANELQPGAEYYIYSTKLRSLQPSEGLSFYLSLPPSLQGVCAATLMERVGLAGLPGGLEAFYQSIPERNRYNFAHDLGDRFRSSSAAEQDQIFAVLAKDTKRADKLEYLLQELPLADQEQLRSTLPASLQITAKFKEADSAIESGDYERAKNLFAEIGTDNNDLLPVSKLAVALADTDPAAAVAWWQSLPDGPAKATASVNLAANWAKADLEGASQWVQSLPREQGRSVGPDHQNSRTLWPDITRDEIGHFHPRRTTKARRACRRQSFSMVPK